MEEREELKSILAYLPVVVRSWSLFWPSQAVEALKELARGPEHSRTDTPSFSMRSCPERNLGNEAGIVFLSQELIGSLLSCSLFCLFPINQRSAKHLPTINFDHLFATLYESYSQKQESKIWCLIHYFEKITSRMPMGSVSFERKVLPVKHSPLSISYPKAEFWSNSVIPLCRFEVQRSGLIEDQSTVALEVDFANKYIGGGALHRGCVQEEIRFMINPELIASMLFMPSMADNEAIEIVGAERFSNYTGYASSFRFSGDYVDERDADSLGRRKTRIIAIDALCSPGMKQYKQELLLREINKAFCGFLRQSKYEQYRRLVPEDERVNQDCDEIQSVDYEDDIGIATGNWGCGAFGGDPEVKTIVQWLAASQALRPFIAYYTFGMKALENLDQVSGWIESHQWTVGDLWDLLVEYSLQRLKGETNDGFFKWLLPSLLASDTEMLD
ncbi:hypothetical protein M0R45_002894 [Rubus argutus]|uniref:poly(ADP-ribose) glycohydrolase n=1 Tax=Rubus argutus TaxID=59490 RepID=A0AAW1YFC0_RUBAR